MASTDQLRHHMIERAVHRPPSGHDNTIALWETLADALSAIIGERAFAALYARSLHATARRFEWLAPHAPGARADHFRLLAAVLRLRAPADAQTASAALLNTFIDTLIALIGDLLTNSILRTAWGDDVGNQAATEHRP
ncbi:MAG: hypothetical protein QFF03_18485 [Pseudomonadota bacterium]|nr:hypothetical protein [Pseudomonadota bacterium]